MLKQVIFNLKKVGNFNKTFNSSWLPSSFRINRSTRNKIFRGYAYSTLIPEPVQSKITKFNITSKNTDFKFFDKEDNNKKIDKEKLKESLEQVGFGIKKLDKDDVFLKSITFFNNNENEIKSKNSRNLNHLSEQISPKNGSNSNLYKTLDDQVDKKNVILNTSMDMNKALKKINELHEISPETISRNINTAEFILLNEIKLCDNENINEEAETYGKIFEAVLEDENFVGDEEKLNTITRNLFKMTEKVLSTKNEFSKEKDQKPRPKPMIPLFFDVCDKILSAHQNSPNKTIQATTEKVVGRITLAMNHFVRNLKSEIYSLCEIDIKNLIKGYMQQLFLLFFDLAYAEFDDWLKLLCVINYTLLTIPINLKTILDIKNYEFMLEKDPDFKKLFINFYSSIVTIILKSEFIKKHEPTIFQFFMDCFCVHFIFIKSNKLHSLCQEIWDLSGPKVNTENIFLRFVSTLTMFPLEFILVDSIKITLDYSLLMLIRFFENINLYKSDRIFIIHQAITKKIMQLIFDLISKKYKQNLNKYKVSKRVKVKKSSFEKEQSLALLHICYWLRIYKNYINYSVEFGNFVKMTKSLFPFKSVFNEILLKLDPRSALKSNKDKLNEISKMILECNIGLNKGIEMCNKQKIKIGKTVKTRRIYEMRPSVVTKYK